MKWGSCGNERVVKKTHAPQSSSIATVSVHVCMLCVSVYVVMFYTYISIPQIV